MNAKIRAVQRTTRTAETRKDGGNHRLARRDHYNIYMRKNQGGN